MLQYNENWPRWIKASCRKFFDDRKQDVPLFYTEGFGTETLDHWAEFRLEGPDAIHLNPNLWYLTATINVVISVSLDLADRDLILKDVGILASCFAIEIPIYKYGDGVDDDQSFFDCLIQDSGEPITITHYGQTNKTINITQSTIEGAYKLHLNHN